MSDTVQDLRQQRAEIVDEMERIAEPKDENGKARAWTEADDAAFADAEKRLHEVDKRIERAERLEDAKRSRAVPAARPVEPQARTPKAPGTGFARIVRSLVAERGHPRAAAAWASDQEWDDKEEIAKALGGSSAAGGGFLVPVEYSSDIIELLRDAAVIMRAQPVVMPMQGTMEIPRLATGVSGSYIGENANIGKEEQTFGNVKLTAKKLASLVPISNDLIRNSSPQADTVVRDDMIAGLSVTMDSAMIRGVGTEYTPKGIRYWAASGNVTETNGTSSAQIESDFSDLHEALLGNNVRMLRAAWLMASRSWSHLYKLRDDNGNLVYPEIRDRSAPGGYGYLYGRPVFVTNHIPINLGGGGNETEIYLVDMADAVVGEETGIEISVSDVAAYHDGSNVQAAFSRDQTVVRAIMRHDFAMRHDVAAAVKTGITWGA